jgi:hypothetical protein
MLLNKIATLIINGEIQDGNTVSVDIKKDELVFDIKKKGMNIAKRNLAKA